MNYVPAREPVLANVDPERIEQAVGILLDNAIKYTPHGGTIFVAVEREDGRAVAQQPQRSLQPPGRQHGTAREGDHRPVELGRCVGAHCVNRTPAFARPSRFGVLMSGEP